MRTKELGRGPVRVDDCSSINEDDSFIHRSEDLIAQMPSDVVAVSESGLRSADDLRRLGALGYRAFLIGERLMTATNPGSALKDLLAAGAGVTDAKGKNVLKVVR